jgi:hypothetical protein
MLAESAPFCAVRGGLGHPSPATSQDYETRPWGRLPACRKLRQAGSLPHGGVRQSLLREFERLFQLHDGQVHGFEGLLAVSVEIVGGVL